MNSVPEICLCSSHGLERLSITLESDAYDKIYRLYSESALGTPFLILCGLRTVRDWQNGLALCHRCICELYEDRREFNGFLPRGIMIDTIELLNETSRLWGCDFICVDFDRLRGKRDRNLLLEMLHRFLKKQEKIEIQLLCRSTPDEDIYRFCTDHHIRKIYLPTQKIHPVRMLFDSLSEKKK